MSSAPKTVTNHKVNLGWPNFFNPQIAILREKEGKKKTSGKKEIAEDKLNESTEKLDNVEDNSNENGDDSSTEENTLKLIDYTIKVNIWIDNHPLVHLGN